MKKFYSPYPICNIFISVDFKVRLNVWSIFPIFGKKLRDLTRFLKVYKFNYFTIVNGSYGKSSIMNRGNGQSGISGSESQSIGHILHSLELTIGIDILVSSRNASQSVANLVLGRIDVGVTVLSVAELILQKRAKCCKKSQVLTKNSHRSLHFLCFAANQDDSGLIEFNDAFSFDLEIFPRFYFSNFTLLKKF